eukprot:CAMPEP_0116900376 /NCGR_PEP_ID=MMETSP0467-20121206/8669_1 /TAXON_ID=283647 /ORGANISM="Mesodinium pulex, Strain SPMC105" /LENGTH=58 /DNA_ID=CAMNT_0004573583 /DNA_START=570 /DNA_END=746 /DNA_ORIENTATION=-
MRGITRNMGTNSKLGGLFAKMPTTPILENENECNAIDLSNTKVPEQIDLEVKVSDELQ